MIKSYLLQCVSTQLMNSIIQLNTQLLDLNHKQWKNLSHGNPLQNTSKKELEICN